MQSLPLPKSLYDEVDSIIQSFLWRHSSSTRKVNLVDWHSMCEPKCNGGLGVKSTTLVMKLGWRFLNSLDSLWAYMLRFKYIKDKSTNFSKSRIYSLSLIWRRLTSSTDDICNASSWCIGSGHKIRLQWDAWLNTVGPLINLVEDSSQIPNVDATLDKVASNGTWDTNQFINALPAFIVGQILSFQLNIDKTDEDSFIWNLSSSGKLTLASAIDFLNQHVNINLDYNINWSKIWSWQGPQRV